MFNYGKPLYRDQAMHFVLDWDGTITKKDTLECLVRIVIESKPEKDVASAWQNWDRCKKIFGEQYQTALDTWEKSNGMPTTVLDERRLLHEIGKVEEISVARVCESGIFEGWKTDGLRRDVEKALTDGSVQMREGWPQFCDFMKRRLDNERTNTDTIDILSVNWSSSFIETCLRATDFPFPISQPTSEALLNAQNQLSNAPRSQDIQNHPITVRLLANTLTPPTHPPTLHTSTHKLQHLTTLKPNNTTCPPLLYIGDSPTDFECLLSADLGICIRDSPMTSPQQRLAATFTRLGIPCARIGERSGGSGVVWARDFREVVRFFGGVG